MMKADVVLVVQAKDKLFLEVVKAAVTCMQKTWLRFWVAAFNGLSSNWNKILNMSLAQLLASTVCTRLLLKIQTT